MYNLQATPLQIINISKLMDEISLTAAGSELVSISQDPAGVLVVSFYTQPTAEAIAEVNAAISIHDHVVPATRILTKLQFRNLFTFPEKISLDTSTDAVMIVIREDFKIAEYIDLDDPNVMGALSLIRDAGIVTQSRMEDILAHQP